MSAFLEEYGKIIVVVIVIAALIVLATIFKTSGSDNAQTSFNSFMGIANNAVNESITQYNNTPGGGGTSAGGTTTPTT